MRLRLLAALTNWNRKDNDSVEKQTDNIELIKPITRSLNQQETVTLEPHTAFRKGSPALGRPLSLAVSANFLRAVKR